MIEKKPIDDKLLALFKKISDRKTTLVTNFSTLRLNYLAAEQRMMDQLTAELKAEQQLALSLVKESGIPEEEKAEWRLDIEGGFWYRGDEEEECEITEDIPAIEDEPEEDPLKELFQKYGVD